MHLLGIYGKRNVIPDAGMHAGIDPCQYGAIGNFDVKQLLVAQVFDDIHDALQRLARYKLPRAIYIVKQLPRNSAGKLIRRELARLIPRSGASLPA